MKVYFKNLLQNLKIYFHYNDALGGMRRFFNGVGDALFERGGIVGKKIAARLGMCYTGGYEDTCMRCDTGRGTGFVCKR